MFKDLLLVCVVDELVCFILRVLIVLLLVEIFVLVLVVWIFGDFWVIVVDWVINIEFEILIIIVVLGKIVMDEVLVDEVVGNVGVLVKVSVVIVFVFDDGVLVIIGFFCNFFKILNY